MRLLSLILILTLSACYRSNSKTLEWNHLSNPKVNNFKYNEDDSIKDTLIMTADTENFKLKIFERQITTDKFPAFSKNVLEMLASYYKEFESPYPGTVSEKVVCTDDVKPRRLSSVDSESMMSEGVLLYANSRYAHGDCDPKDLMYQALHALIHCKKSNITYEFKYFIKKSETSSDALKAVFADMKCI